MKKIDKQIKTLFEGEPVDGTYQLTDKPFKIDDALIEKIKSQIDIEKYDIEELKMGIEVEKEHGSKMGEDTNVTKDDPVMTAKIAIAHLKELPDYYTRLARMEEEGKKKDNTISESGN